MFEQINENLILVSSKFIKQKEYWKKKLPGDIRETMSPFGTYRHKRGDQKGFETKEIYLPDDLSGKLMQLSNQNDLALYMVLLAALKVLIYRCTSNETITVLSPTYKNNETEETINDLLSICDSLRHDLSFKELLQSIRQAVLEAYENQDYPFDTLMESLFVSSHRQDSAPSNILSNILCSLENIHDDINIEERNPGLFFSFLRRGDKIEGKMRYNISAYDKHFLERVPEYLVNVLNEFFRDMSIKISAISFLSEPEKRQLLDHFNDTRLEYPREKSINQLFSEQVDKTPDAIAVVGAWAGGGYEPPEEQDERFIAAVTYRELKRRVDQLAHVLKAKGVKPDTIVAIKVERSLEMIISMLGILEAGGAYLPISLAYPEERVRYILKDSKPGILIATGDLSGGTDVPGVIDLLDNNIYADKNVNTGGIKNTNTPTDLVYVIYTSGSSGKPKGVMVEHRQVINLVYGLRETIYKKYSPHLNVALIAPYEFDASAQQIYASLLLGHSLHIVPDETKVNGAKLLEYYKKYTINISDGTPTHLRLIVKSIGGNTKGLAVEHFIIAGEVLPKSVAGELLNGFENGAPGLSNIYGPTETCVDSTFFNVTAQRLTAYDTVPIGKALPNEQVYILDKNCKPQPIGVAGEMCITGDGVSRGYLNQPALTAEKFIPQSFGGESAMYRTGDLARWLPDGNIEYLERIDGQVKIRGYRIETGEIENQLRKREEIKEAVVLAKGEKAEDIYLCAYIVSESQVKTPELRKWLSGYLPDYMIPAHFVKLDRLPLTANGKLDIKAFPSPELKSAEAYIAPRDALERKLAEIWSDVLSGDLLNSAPVERLVVGIDDNFFELGGHSLKATTLVYQICKELNVNVKIIDIFTSPTIRELAQKLTESETLEYIEISPVEEREYYDLSYAQRRLWVLCQFEEESTAYNIPSAIIISGSLCIDSFKNAVQTLAHRHESLRTVFITLNGEPKQKIIRDFEFNLEQVDLCSLGADKEETTRKIYREFANRALDLEEGPLFQYKLLWLDKEKYLLMSNFHHIINDGWSLGIISSELIALYNEFLSGGQNPLPPLRLQYKDYTRWHNQLIEAGHFYKSRQYWLEKFKDKPNGIDLPLDHPRQPIQTFNGARIHFTLDKKELLPLYRSNSNEETTLFMALLTLWSILLYKYSGQNDVIIGFPIAGRKHTEFNHIIGFLVNTLVFRNKIESSESFVNLLEKFREETLTSYDYQDYPFDLFVEELGAERDLSQFPLFNVMIAHSNANTQEVEWEAKGLSFTNYSYKDDFNMSKFDLVFFIDEHREKLHMMFEYNSDLFERMSIERMRENFLYLVDQSINNIECPISSYNIIAPVEYGKVTRDFNDTGYRFPALSLAELFENRVEKCPGKTAVVHDGDKISYENLNKKGNRLAHYLREECNVKPNDIIGVSMDRSIEMIVTLWGIIKSGAAYLALDPTYPMDRVLEILDNSKTERLIIDKKQPEFLSHYDGGVLNISAHRDKISRCSSRNPALVNKPSDILYVNYTSGSTGTPNGALLSHDILTNLIQWQIEISSIDCSLACLQFTTINFCVSFQEIMGTLTAGGELHLIGDIERQDIDYLMDFLEEHKIQVLFLPFSYLNFLFNESSRWNRSFNHHLKHIITAGEQLKISSGLKRFLESNPDLKLHNHYGSTEMHVVTSYTLDASTADKTPIPPAGKPISNVKIYILDEYRSPVPIGVWGELYVAGSSEILGYINNSDLTKKKLLPLPPGLSEQNDHKRVYRSGDIGRWDEYGNIELRGRKDSQVKVRGFRVELGEIESKILSIEHVKECVVVVKDDQSGNKGLFAYIVVENLDAAKIKEIIGNHLPQYMIPKFIILDKLPLMPNGKVDREKLPDPQAVGPIKIGTVSDLMGDEKYTRDVLAGIRTITDRTPIEEVIAYYASLLRQAVSPRAFNISKIDCNILPGEELIQMIRDASHEPGEIIRAIPQLFAHQVEKTPGNIAVTDASGTITYLELHEKSNRMAHLLKRKGVSSGTVVGIMGEPEPDMIAGILGVLKAGGAYLVIPPGTPLDRVSSRLQEDRVSLLLSSTRAVKDHSYTGLQGLSPGSVTCRQTASRPPIADLDGLPFPDRSMVNYEKYSRRIGITMVKDSITLLTSRGCPYKCAYCHKIWPSKQISRSAENIFSEVKFYYDIGVRRFAFIDDIFNLDMKNSTRFFQMVLENGIDAQFYFSGGLRGDILTPGYIDLMVEAGTVNIAMALETASPRLQKFIGKNLDVGKLKENIQYICKNHPQIILELHTMHGFPTETKEEAVQTLDFIKSLEWVDFPYIHLVRIYPNSRMEQLALENGISEEAILKSEGLAFHEWSETLPFEKEFSQNYQAEFLNNYFLSKERLLHVIPRQMKVLTEEDMVQKYHSYLPMEIKKLDDLLQLVDISREELGVSKCRDDDSMSVPDLNRKIKEKFSASESVESDEHALRILLLDLSQFFSLEGMLYDVVEVPLGIISLLSYLNRQLGKKINGKCAKARIDFDNYDQLKTMIRDFNPHVIGIRTLTFYKDFFHKTVGIIRQWGIDVPIIAGGPYASSDFQTLLQDSNVDLVVLGEGEITFLELVGKILDNDKKLPGHHILETIPGLAYIPPGEKKAGKYARELLMLDQLEETIKKESPGSLELPGEASGLSQIVYFPTGEKENESRVMMTHEETHRLVSGIGGIDGIADGRPPDASFLFELSPHQVFGSLLRGGTLHVPPQSGRNDNIQLLGFYHHNESPGSPGITTDIRLLLKKQAYNPFLTNEAYVPPENEIQSGLVEIWADVLGIEKKGIGIDNNFFEIGGHSLKATLVVSEIHKKLNKKIPLVEMFKNPTIREFSNYMKSVEEHEYVSVKPVEKREWYALSSAQKRLYVLHHMKKEDNLTYNMPQVVMLEGRLDKDKLEETFRQLISRHESLRTSFEMIGDEPVQRPREFHETAFEMKRRTADVGKEGIDGLIKNFIKPFDLSIAPLFRVELIEENSRDKFILMIDMHHIISDGTSINIFINEFMAIYEGKRLPALRLQYKDYSQWQRSELQREAIRQQEAFWVEQFQGETPVLDLPWDFPRPPVQRFEGSAFRFELGKEETRSLKEFTLKQNVTLYMVMLAIYNILLAKLNRQDEIVVGTPVACRKHADLRQIIGMFINTLAMKNQPSGEKSFDRFVREVGEKTLKAFNNQDYQYEELVERVAVTRDAGRNPLFDVMLTLQNVDIPAVNIEGLKLTSHAPEHHISKFDLNLVGVEGEGNLFFAIEYCTALFKKETIERFTIYLREIVNTVIQYPGIKISDIEIITELEKRQVLYEFNRTGTAYPKEKTIPRLFEEQVEKTPDKPAIVFEDKKLTYRILDERAARLAIQLRKRGVKADTIVGIMVEKSLEMLLGVIAILKAGGGYLPIDVEYPEERKRYMLEDSCPVVLLTREKYCRQMKPGVEVIDISKDDIFNDDNFKLETINRPGDLAYVIYTSGSTGRPKGVMVNHRNVVRLVKNTNFIKFEKNDRLLQTGALEFDASTFELWGSLLNGLTLYIVPKDNILSAEKLDRALRKYDISTMWMTSPLFNRVSGINSKIFASLRNLVVGGDVLSPSHINPVKRNYRELNIINGYGPTENTTFSATFPITKEYERSIPIGKPIANSTAYIVDRSGKLLPVGVVGQLCVGGDGLARGYLNNPELTKEKFIYSSTVPGEILYQTGDLTRWLPDGNIEFIGRVDHQVKVRGFRVELGEIESRLSNIEEIKEVLVTVIERSTGAGHWKEKSFCAYFVSGKEFAVSELRNILSGSLPDYMIPAYFVRIEKMPLTPNGKIDRRALPLPEAGAVDSYIAPRDETEEKLVEIWSDLLGVDKSSIGIDADFFKLGGHSLTATVLLARVHREFNVQIQLVEIFSLPTIRELGELLKLEAKKILTSIEPAEEKEYYVLSSAQEKLYMQQQMDPGSIAYNVPEMIEIEGELQKESVEKTIAKLIDRHESFRTSFETIEGEAVQRIHDEIEFAVKYRETGDEKVRELAGDFIKPFDLSKVPLLRVELVKLGEIRYLLMLDIHHIIFDGISRASFIQDFFTLYSGRELPALKLRYRDYSEWQNSADQRKTLKKQEKYWLKQFEGKIPLLDLPTDYDRCKMKNFRGESISFEIDEDKSGALREWALEEGVTLFMLLLAMYYVLLAKLTGQEDIVVGTGVMGRRHPDLEPIIGMFVNMLALRNYPREDKPFSDFLKDVKETTLSALENQDYPYETLAEQLLKGRKTGGNSLFDAVFSVQTIEPNVEKISDLKFKPFRYEKEISKFDMTMVVVDKGEKLFFNVEYNTDILKQETIEIYIKYFKEIMVTVLENKDCRVKDIIVIHNLSAPGLKLLQEEEDDFGF